MIIYLHGFDSNSPGNHEKVLQLQFIDSDVRFINYSTLHPKHDMQHLLKEVHKAIEQSGDPNPLICGVGLGGYWSERIGFLCGIKQVIFNPNLHPELTMQGRIDRPEEYEDISTKCVEKFRAKNQGRCLVILSVRMKFTITRKPRKSCKTITTLFGMTLKRINSKKSLIICKR